MLPSRFSPLRLLDRLEGGPLHPGEIGVLMAAAGVGKTSCLVQMAIDHLLKGDRVAHVTLDQPVARVSAWYGESLKDLAEAAGDELRLPERQTTRRRLILGFQAGRFTVEALRRQLDLLANGEGLAPDLVIIDGFDLHRASNEEVAAIGQLARDLQVSVWMAALTRDPVDPGAGGVPPPCDGPEDHLAVALYIDPQDASSLLRVFKDRHHPVDGSVHIRLNPRTLLVQIT